MTAPGRHPDADPFRAVAMIALQASPAYLGDMLEEVIRYAFEQLCWKRSTPDLIALLAELSATVTEDA